MTQPYLRFLIRGKLAAGRLPRNYSSHFWAGPGNGEICHGCEETVTEDQMLMENRDAAGCELLFHVACFHVWNAERQLPGHETIDPA